MSGVGGRRVGCRVVGSRAFCGSNTNKDNSEWELAGSTKVPCREGRPGKREARGIDMGAAPYIPTVLNGEHSAGLRAVLCAGLWDFGCGQGSRLLRLLLWHAFSVRTGKDQVLHFTLACPPQAPGTRES